ncbi:tyrosine-type recombinase/integrase [Kitasatospora sp. NPDC001119]
MRRSPTPDRDRGSVYRRCGCRDDHRRQLGTRCPHLAADPHHGSWAFAVDAPSTDSHLHTVRRGDFPDELDARIALRRFNESLPLGVVTDPRQSTADYLSSWLAEKALRLKPTTIARYRDYITQDLIPALGASPSTTSPASTWPPSSPTSCADNGAGSPSTGSCPPSPAPSPPPSTPNAWPATPQSPRSSPAPQRPSGTCGPRSRRPASCASPTSPSRCTPTSPS